MKYGSGSPDCIDTAVETYLIDKTLPPEGTKCDQDVPFTAPQSAAAKRSAAPDRVVRPHTRPLPRLRR